MHETGLLHAAVAALADAADGRPIAEVTLAIGPGVDPDAAAHAWSAAVPGTPAAQAAVTWIRAEDGLTCLTCGRDYTGDRLSRCPRCAGNGLVVAPAPEIEILGWSDGQV